MLLWEIYSRCNHIPKDWRTSFKIISPPIHVIQQMWTFLTNSNAMPSPTSRGTENEEKPDTSSHRNETHAQKTSMPSRCHWSCSLWKLKESILTSGLWHPDNYTLDHPIFSSLLKGPPHLFGTSAIRDNHKRVDTLCQWASYKSMSLRLKYSFDYYTTPKSFNFTTGCTIVLEVGYLFSPLSVNYILQKWSGLLCLPFSPSNLYRREESADLLSAMGTAPPSYKHPTWIFRSWLHSISTL